MGYSICWKRDLEIEPTRFNRIVEDFKVLLKPLYAAGVRLAGGDGHGKPVIDPKGIYFNGASKCRHKPSSGYRLLDYVAKFEGSSEEEMAALFDMDWVERRCPGFCCFETFSFLRDEWTPHFARDPVGWHSCKTNRRHYDLAVQCVLIIAKHHLEEKIELSGKDRFWSEGRSLCQAHLGYGASLPLFASGS